jgi:LmbE family N-acetylglucosaminyl deacetylase
MTELIPGVLVVSPRLGSAVFGCGAALSGVTDARVCTLFGGIESERDVRIAEDEHALALLTATPVRLNFTSSARPTRTALGDALRAVIRDFHPRVLMIPLGLNDADHILAHHAACDAWIAHPALTCLAYEESFHRRVRGLVQARLIDLHARGIDATPICATAAQPFDAERRQALKREAVSAYASRLKALGPDGFDDVFHAERFWKLEPAQQR